MDQKIIDLYDHYTHGLIDRRDFLDRLASLAGSSAAALAMLPLLQNNYALAQIVPENDARIVTETASFDGPGGKISGYMARRTEKGKRPAVLIIHENRGLNPHIKDIARRIALEGFLAYAVDLLSTSGGTPEDEEKGRDMIAKLSLDDAEKQTVAAVAWLKKHPDSAGTVGAVGFCWGGAMTNRLAAGSPELTAAVVYYGRAVDSSRVPNIKAPLLLNYAENDAGVNGTKDEYEAALKANNKKFRMHTYPGTQHAFNNDTAGPRYNKVQADIAWSRMIYFYKDFIGSPPL